MNHWEIDNLADRYGKKIMELPVLAKATTYLQLWKDHVNEVSDGWAYWHVASGAASKLMAMIQNAESVRINFGTVTDANEADFKKAVAQIKSFVTRYKKRHPEAKVAVPELPELRVVVITGTANNGFVCEGAVVLVGPVGTKNCWRAEGRVNNTTMSHSHHDTAVEAQAKAWQAQQSYLLVHAKARPNPQQPPLTSREQELCNALDETLHLLRRRLDPNYASSPEPDERFAEAVHEAHTLLTDCGIQPKQS